MARSGCMQHTVRYRHSTVATSRTDRVQVTAHIDGAAKVAEAGADTAAKAHSSVAGLLYDDHLIVQRTGQVQRLHCTVLDRRRHW